MRSKWFTLFSIVVLASMLLAACTPAAAPTPVVQEVVKTVVVTQIVEGQPKEVVITATPAPVVAAAKPAILKINLATYPDTIDPQKSSFVNEIAHLKLIYEGLTRLNDKLETVPGAAEKWEYNKEATELTFTIRKGLKYSDGSLLNAKRFEFALLRNIDPATAGEYAQITDDIKGANAWRTADLAKLKPEEVGKLKAAVGVQALDAAGAACKADKEGYAQEDCLTLKITTEKPAPYFHTVAGIWVGYPAKEELIAEGGDIWWNSSKFQVGNGPFVLQNLEPFVRAYFTPNANYWRGVAKYDIEYRYITDTAVAFEAYKNGEFDQIPLGAEDTATAKADPVLSKELAQFSGVCTFAVMFHGQKAPFNDPKIREAFAYALDRKAWVADVLKGVGVPAMAWIPPGLPGNDPTETRFQFDAEKAKASLAASTYKDAATLNKDAPVTATFSDTPRNRTRWEWLASKWKTVLGVDIKLNPVESTTFTALTKDIKTAPQMFILGWCQDYPDPQNWLSVYWKTGGFGERIAYSNPEVDKLLNQADSSVDVAARADLYTQAQKMVTSDLPAAYMYHDIHNYLTKPYVKGLVATPMDSDWMGSNDPLTVSIDTAAIK